MVILLLRKRVTGFLEDLFGKQSESREENRHQRLEYLKNMEISYYSELSPAQAQSYIVENLDLPKNPPDLYPDLYHKRIAHVDEDNADYIQIPYGNSLRDLFHVFLEIKPYEKGSSITIKFEHEEEREYQERDDVGVAETVVARMQHLLDELDLKPQYLFV